MKKLVVAVLASVAVVSAWAQGVGSFGAVGGTPTLLPIGAQTVSGILANQGRFNVGDTIGFTANADNASFVILRYDNRCALRIEKNITTSYKIPDANTVCVGPLTNAQATVLPLFFLALGGAISQVNSNNVSQFVSAQ